MYLQNSFDDVNEHAMQKTSTGHKEQQEPATNHTIKIITDRMPYELEFYDLVKRRYQQLKKYYLEDGPVPQFLLESARKLKIPVFGL